MIDIKNKINTLSLQITALLELMQCANDSADISSIRVASEMCLTMHDELMVEVDKIYKDFVWKSNKQESREREVENE